MRPGTKASAIIIIGLILLAVTSALPFCFKEAARLYGLDPRLLEALARVESNMNARALNRNGDGSVDVGLMQINSYWKDILEWDLVREDPCYNVLAGAWILRTCMSRYGAGWDAISCYISGKPLKALKGKTRKRVQRYIWKVYRELTKDQGE